MSHVNERIAKCNKRTLEKSSIFSNFFLMQDILLSTWSVIILGLVFLYSLWFTFALPPADPAIQEGIFGATDKNGKPNVEVIAHRGFGMDAPENSLTAFKLVSTIKN